MATNPGHALNEQQGSIHSPQLPTQGGYDVIDTTVYNSSGAKMRQNDILALECPICLKILRNPVQLITCGCRYCTSCIDRLLAKKYVVFTVNCIIVCASRYYSRWFLSSFCISIRSLNFESPPPPF